MVTDPTTATDCLIAATRGDARAADHLMEAVYGELRAMAAHRLGQDIPEAVLQPTSLVHEAYLRMVDQSRVSWKNQTHFKAVAAIQMWRVLCDHLRAARRLKRGHGWQRVTLSRVAADGSVTRVVELLALHDAIEKLEQIDDRQALIIRLRYFAGLTIDQAASYLNLSPRTVDGDWAYAKVWLKRELSRGESQ